MPVIPGAVNAIDIIAALDHGIRLVKFFPEEASGGIKVLRSIHRPFPDVRLIPTGGIDASNAGSYLRQPFVAAVGGSWMVAPEHVHNGNFDTITSLTAEAIQIVSQARA